jgi:hypothetical protein
MCLIGIALLKDETLDERGTPLSVAMASIETEAWLQSIVSTLLKCDPRFLIVSTGRQGIPE